MTSPRRINESGLCTVWSFDGDGRQFANDVIAECTRCEYCLVLIFYSQQHYPPASFLEPLAERLDGPIIAGCSTAGELTPEGLQENNIVAMLFPVTHFSADAELIEDVAVCGMEDIVNRVAVLRERFTGGDHDRVFAISVIDGLSRSEESVTTAINRALDGITLLGGSSGDDLLFTRTTQVFGNRNYSGAAIVFSPSGDLRIAGDMQHTDTENSGQSAFADILRTEPIIMRLSWSAFARYEASGRKICSHGSV